MAGVGLLVGGLLLFFLIASFQSVKQNTSTQYSTPHDALLDGRVQVDVMEFTVPVRAAELSRRISLSIVKDFSWYRENLQQASSESFPYDSRMGITQQEYEEYLELSKQIGIRKVGESAISILNPKANLYVLDGGKADGQASLIANTYTLSNFSGIEIDLANKRVGGPIGVLTEQADVSGDAYSPIGAWTGTQWSTQNQTLNGPIATFTIGQIRRSGRCFMYLNATRTSSGQYLWVELLLIYDLPRSAGH